MNVTELAALTAKVYGFIKPVITSKVSKEIAGDFKNATKGTILEIWEKIKPWFIIEDEETEELKDLKSAPEDENAEDAFKDMLKAKLRKNDALRDDLVKLLTDLEKSNDPAATIIITNSRNVMTGNITGVTGDIHIGDVIDGPHKDR